MFNGYLLMILIIAMPVLLFKINDRSLWYIIFSTAILIVWIGLRDVSTIGIDSRVNYSRLYSVLTKYSFSDIFSGDIQNVGLRVLMKFSSQYLQFDYQAFTFTLLALIYIIFGRMIYKYSTSPMQSIICHCGLLYFFLFMDALKQCVAMAFICLAFDCIIYKKPIRFLIFTLIGGFFHTPALIFLPAYFVANQKNIKLYGLELFCLFLFVFVFRSKLLSLMDDAYGVTISGNGTFFKNKVLIMLFIIVFAFILRPPTDDDTVYVVLLRLMGLAAVLQTFTGFSNNFERLADYYFQFSVLFIPMIFAKPQNDSELTLDQTDDKVLSAILLVVCIYFIYRFASYAGGMYQYVPYRFYWM